MTNKPFLVVSYSIPDRLSGTPVVIRKFLENFSKEEVVLIGRPTLRKNRLQNNSFHYPILTIPTPPVDFYGERLWRFLSCFIGVITGLIAIILYKPKAILAFYRDESSLFIGYWLHKMTRLPLYTYFCDIYLENYPKGFYGKLAAWLQPRVFHESKKVIVLTEAMKDYYKQNYQIDAMVLPHCNNLSVPEIPQKKIRENMCLIGYLGSINIDRVQSLRLLCQAIQGNSHYHLTYFSPTSAEYIQHQELNIENSSIEFIRDNEKLVEKLSSCDILFLPLTISQGRHERVAQVATGFPTKVIEYLLCQVPILVHCDENSFVSKFFEENKCGYIVYGGTIELLSALNILNNDPGLRKNLLENSVNTLSYFDGKSISNSFRNLLEC